MTSNTRWYYRCPLCGELKVRQMLDDETHLRCEACETDRPFEKALNAALSDRDNITVDDIEKIESVMVGMTDLPEYVQTNISIMAAEMRGDNKTVAMLKMKPWNDDPIPSISNWPHDGAIMYMVTKETSGPYPGKWAIKFLRHAPSVVVDGKLVNGVCLPQTPDGKSYSPRWWKEEKHGVYRDAPHTTTVWVHEGAVREDAVRKARRLAEMAKVPLLVEECPLGAWKKEG